MITKKISQKYLLEYAKKFHNNSEPRYVKVFGESFVVLPTVHRPDVKLLTEFQYTHIDLHQNDFVLDMGCGSGVLSIALAKMCNHVVAVDVNPNAIKNTKLNCRLFRAENISAVESDLFINVNPKEKFDSIVFNAPFFRINPTDMQSRAWCYNIELFDNFFVGAKTHLKENGRIYILFSSVGYSEDIIKPARENGFRFSIIATTKEYQVNEISEQYMLYCFTKDTM